VGWVMAFVMTYSVRLLLLSQFEVFAIFPQLLLHIISDDRKLISDAHTYRVRPVVENSCSCRAQSSRCRSTLSHEDSSRSNSRNLLFLLKHMDKSEGKRPLGRPRRRWEDNIKMDLQEVGYGGMDWIELAQDTDRRQALANAVMNLPVL